MNKKFISTPRGRVYYWIGRPGARDRGALVFLHGLTADHRLFEKQTEHFAKTWTVIAWDAPAHGCSRPYGDFSYAHCAEDLKAILDAEEIASAVLVGQSAGGFAAQFFIGRWPERASGFVSIDSCPVGAAYYSASDLWWLRQAEWMSRCFPAGALRRALSRACAATPDARESMDAMLAQYDKDELCRLMGLGFAGFRRENADLRLSCPVCLMLGDADRTGKVAQYNRAWQKKEGFPLHVIPGAAHNANADNAPEVNRLLTEFLDALPQPEAPAGERPMRFDILTLFPEMCRAVVGESIIGRAAAAGRLQVFCHNIRSASADRHHRTDDNPYGGGKGMVMQCQPIYDCWREVCRQIGARPHTVYLSPKGAVLTQARARELAKKPNLVLLCGHYEGVDQRVLDLIVDEELSVGDYVLTGGELAALIVVDCVGRLRPGVLSDEECFTEESHWNSLLEYPQYTRPPVWNGAQVPPALQSGDHAAIAAWRRRQSLRVTLAHRPDLLEHAELTPEDRRFLQELKKATGREE